MKASEIRSMTREELDHELNELREEEFRLRLRRPTEDLPNALRLRTIRRDIARIQTLLREDKLGIIKLPSKSVRETKKTEAAAVEEKKEEHVKKESEKKAPAKKASVKKPAAKKAPAKKTSSKKAPAKKAAKPAPKKKVKSASAKKTTQKASKGNRK